MKRAISISIILIFLFFTFQWGFNYYKEEHDISYKVYAGDKTFEVREIYQKNSGDVYDIIIKNGNETYSYIIDNNYNKQKEIIKKVEYYTENNTSCIYPVLEDDKGTYIECLSDKKVYTDTSFSNQNLITKIKADLTEKGYLVTTNINFDNTTKVGSSTIYSDSLLPTDIITLWNYKGINIIKSKDSGVKTTINFDKYENKHGYLIKNYYVIPNYLSSRVQEFSSVTIINLENKESVELELGYTLSSDTYINGVIEEKLYYTDPSNLLQVEVNPAKKHARLIGSKDIGGQLYQNGWKDANIYDFVTNKLLFQEEIPSEVTEKYNYKEIIESNNSYYFYTSSGEVYRVSKNNLETAVLLFKKNNLNNFKVVDNTVYFVVNDTLYYFDEKIGIVQVLKNNELRYNTVNRIAIYRKS